MKRAVLLLVAIAAAALVTARETRGIELDPARPTVLITGSNRGIGLGFASHYAQDGWNVIATARNPDEATALRALADRFDTVHLEELDVIDDADVRALARKYAGVPIDLLINNAAFHGGGPEERLFGSYDYATFERYMAVNVFGPLRISEALIDSIAASKQKKIVALSTGLASLANSRPVRCAQFQAISKAAMNKAMRGLQLELRPRGVIVALISPGTVETDGFAAIGNCERVLGGSRPPSRAALSVEQSVAAMVKIIAGLDNTYDGSHLDPHGNVVPW
jgi:NAD(P)-dependent dehydrogenase (short-subunit alcohol dehydrogenase family)